jgi:hypothetical protein
MVNVMPKTKQSEDKFSDYQAPIFILGIHGRSGTNFLADLLSLHPDCAVPSPIMEDYILHHADVLVDYSKSVFWHWSRVPTWKIDDRLEDLLLQGIGNGLIKFINSQADKKRIVTKTPSIRNLELFFKLFPDAYLLILVRDGRAVVESCVKSFGWNYEETMRKWAYAAHLILEFDRNNSDSNLKYMILRYEDIHTNPVNQLHQIFDFVGLDVEAYDFEAAINLPVKGSSMFRGQGKKNVHWKPVEKTAEFDPLQRWKDWSRAQHERFNWIAGKYMIQFGYEEERYSTNQHWWDIWNRILDFRLRAKLFFSG